MPSKMISVPVSIVRGGTSKGIFILKNKLPTDVVLRDKIILAIFGSPDLRQVDGIGGADPLTSKLAIIGPSTRPDADVDYIFGQVSITAPFIDYAGNCGNISSAVGSFAIDRGMVKITEPITAVRIHMVNTGRLLTAYIPVEDGEPCVDGDYAIDGVPGFGAKIDIDWADCGGETTGKILPTGSVAEHIEAQGKNYNVSIVDAGNVTVFINAEALGLTGAETPTEIETDKELMALIEEIRGKAACRAGLLEDWKQSTVSCPYAPFFSIISASQTHQTFNGKNIKTEDIDVVSRLLFMQQVHKAHPVTGTVALGCAARIPGTIVHQRLASVAHNADELHIGHPSGIIQIASDVDCDGEYKLTKSMISRTARIIMDGNVYIRDSQLL